MMRLARDLRGGDLRQARQTRITSSLAAEGFEGITERPISRHLVMLVGFYM